jgi:hypothetical protein
MFRLIDRVQGGIEPMLKYLEEHITSTGLADMIAAASIITQVRKASVYPFCVHSCVKYFHTTFLFSTGL